MNVAFASADMVPPVLVKNGGFRAEAVSLKRNLQNTTRYSTCYHDVARRMGRIAHFLDLEEEAFEEIFTGSYLAIWAIDQTEFLYQGV